MAYIREKGKILVGENTVESLTDQFNSPLFVYDEQTIRNRCQELKRFCGLPNFQIHYAVKANSTIGLLKIIREEGIQLEVMSLGEIYIASAAGCAYRNMLFSSNNVSPETFSTVSGFGIKVCLDSVSQIETYGQSCQKGEIYIRLNPNRGDGHHTKVVTAGKVKFGIDFDQIETAFSTAKKFNLSITGFCIHIGSNFERHDIFHENMLHLLELTEKYPSVKYVDFGGGFGVPYDRKKEKYFPFEDYMPVFNQVLKDWLEKTGRKTTFGIQPGRYIVAEAGICLAKVTSIKKNKGIRFIGTDLGFNLLLRPVLYDAYHEIINGSKEHKKIEKVTVVGNICESGDIIGSDRDLPVDTAVGDILVVRDTGAYGYSMSGNYNSITRPAEVMIDRNGKVHMIRKAENYDDLLRGQIR